MSSEVAATLTTAIGGVLAVAAFTKWIGRTDLAPFLAAVGAPQRISKLLAPLIAPLELGAAVLLIVRPWSLVSAALSVCITTLFAVLQFRAARVGQGCRCFGALDRETTASIDAPRAVLLWLMADSAFVLTWIGHPSPSLRPFALAGGMMAAATVIILFALAGSVLAAETARRLLRTEHEVRI